MNLDKSWEIVERQGEKKLRFKGTGFDQAKDIGKQND